MRVRGQQGVTAGSAFLLTLSRYTSPINWIQEQFACLFRPVLERAHPMRASRLFLYSFSTSQRVRERDREEDLLARNHVSVTEETGLAQGNIPLQSPRIKRRALHR